MSKTENITEKTDAKGNVTHWIGEDKVVLIECAAGHTYWRKSQRGKRPVYCPEHKPVEESAPTERTSSTWAGPSEYELAHVYPLVKDSSEKAKLAYFDEQLQTPIWSKSLADPDDDPDSPSYVVPSEYRTREDHYDLRKWRSDFLSSYARRAGKKVEVEA